MEDAMADWQLTLDLTPQFERAQQEEITIEEMARVVADRMEVQNPVAWHGQHLEDERISIAEDFRDIADGAGDVDDFDEAMARLYDWGDTKLDGEWNGKKLCWVRTH